MARRRRIGRERVAFRGVGDSRDLAGQRLVTDDITRR